MKVIPKLQQGGYFNIWKPLFGELIREPAPSPRGTEGYSKSDDKGKLTEKDLFSMLEKIKGLPNEMLELFSEFSSELLMARDGIGVSDIASTYASTLAKLKLYEYNKEIFKDAYDRAVDAGNLNDIAITVSGHVVILDDKGNLKAISPELYVKNKENYHVLTNSNLLYLRSHSPNYVGRNDIFLTVENGISLENVSKMIQERIQLGGSISLTSDNFLSLADLKSVRPTTKEELAGLLLLQKTIGQGPEGFYKIHNESSSNRAAIDAALGYIYKTLPKNAKVRLSLETDNGSLQEVVGIIQNMLTGKLDVSSKSTASYVGTKGGTTSDGVTIGGTDSKETAATRFLKGYGDKASFNLNLGSSGNISVDTISLPLTDASDTKGLGTMQPISEVSKSSYGSLLDWENASMGMGILNPSGHNQVIEKNARIYSIDFPVRRTADGHIVPDLMPDRVEKKKAADEELKQMGIDLNNIESRKKNYQTINKVYEKYGFVAPYNSNGDIDNKSWARFAVIEAYADNRNLENEHPSLLREIRDYEKKNLERILKGIDKNYTPGGGLTNGLFSKFEGIYEGLLWVPIKGGYNSAQITQEIKEGDSKTYDTYDQMRNIPILNNQQFNFGLQLSN